MPVKKECSFCSKDFLVYPSASEAKFCSRECAYKSRYGESFRKGILKICPVCNTNFKVTQSAAKVRKYCCESCKKKAEAATFKPKICQRCGNEYLARLFRYERSKFCSKICKHGTRLTKICEHCTKSYNVPICKKDTKYCSKTCLLQAKQIALECQTCKNTFKRPKCHIDFAKFCSMGCYAQSMVKTQKQCSKCLQVLPVNEFVTQNSRCKECFRIERIEKKYAYLPATELSDKLTRFKALKGRQNYIKQNPDLRYCPFKDHYVPVAEMRKGYCVSCCNLFSRQKQYYRRDPERYRSYRINRAEKIIKAGGTFTISQWREKVKYFGNSCYLCRESLEGRKRHIEHRIPIARGGTNWIANIAPACERCNLSKHTKTEREYREWLKSLT